MHTSFEASPRPQCSMVLLGEGDFPVTVSESGDNSRNIEWRDHRALKQVEEINKGGFECLKYVGGTMSPEQQVCRSSLLCPAPAPALSLSRKRTLVRCACALLSFVLLGGVIIILTQAIDWSHRRLQPPKLRWLKENLPSSWERARKAFDLSDWLVYSACGKDVRSVCTVGCKWGYLAHENREWSHPHAPPPDASCFEEEGRHRARARRALTS